VRKPLFILVFMLAVLAFSVLADNETVNQTVQSSENCTYEVNCSLCEQECNLTSNFSCPECPESNCTYPWQNVSFDFVISPGEHISDYKEYSEQDVGLIYDVECIACSQEKSDICSIEKTIDPGDDYSRQTSLCDVEISCEACDEEKIIKQSCPDGNRTVEIPFMMETRNNDNDLYIYVGQKPPIIHTLGEGLSYESDLKIQCPACDIYSEEANITFAQCRAYADELCFSEEAANFMVTKLSGSVQTMAETRDKCADDLAVANSNLQKCQTDRQNRDLTIKDQESRIQELSDELSLKSSQYENCTRNLKACQDDDRCGSMKGAFIAVTIIAVLLFGWSVFSFIWIYRLKTLGGDV